MTELPALKEFLPSLSLGVCFVQGMKSSASRGKAVRTPHKHTNPAEQRVCSRTSPGESQINPAGHALGKTVAESGHIKPVKHGLHVRALLTSLYVPAEQAVGSLMPMDGHECPRIQLQ